MEHMKTIKKQIKGVLFVLLAAFIISGAMPVQAASKKIDIRISQATESVTFSNKKLIVHTKGRVQLIVNMGGENIAKKATYKSNKPNIVSVDKNGRLKAKKNGNATITVKYNGVVKKLKITAGKHKWKAVKRTKKIRDCMTTCNYCGATFQTYSLKKVNGLWSHVRNDREHYEEHIRKGEPAGVTDKLYYKKVTYIHHYECTCGDRKAGDPEPQDVI